jgi:hypothetical protein
MNLRNAPRAASAARRPSRGCFAVNRPRALVGVTSNSDTVRAGVESGHGGVLKGLCLPDPPGYRTVRYSPELSWRMK